MGVEVRRSNMYTVGPCKYGKEQEAKGGKKGNVQELE